MRVLQTIVAVLALLCTVNPYKILVVSPMPSVSHKILGDGLVRHLANAGHEITYITAYVPKKTHQNVKILDVSENQKTFTIFDMLLGFEDLIEKNIGLNDIITAFRGMLKLPRDTLENPNVNAVLVDENKHFDLVLAEWMFSEIYAGLSAIFDCPLIWFSTMEPHWRILRLIDEMPNSAYTSDQVMYSHPPFTFAQRLGEFVVPILGLLFEQFLIDGIEAENYENVIVPILKKRGKAIPSLQTVRYNASIVLGNSHVSLGVPFRLPDSYKAIGGYHIEEEVKPLPQDLQSLLDNAKDGLIYFSLGSILKSNTFPNEIKTNLLKTLGELKQTVLWKFEEDLPNRPKNVHIVQWAPQASILAHENCILFITHGGLLSTTEAIHYGVPIIGIPAFADQFMNVDRAVNKGFAKQVDLSYTMVDELKIAIQDILNNQSYSQKVKELSLIYHDRPVSPGAELVHWVEHVIRTRGAPHLRSPALMVPWYQKLYVDLVALLITIILVIKHVIKLVLRSRRKLDISKKNK